MHKTTLVSLVIPVYNRSAFLPRLFASLVRVMHRPLEIVLVDNCSSDASYSDCLDFQQKYHCSEFQIKVVQESRCGACVCRNKGLRLSTGRYVYFFDSDDEMSANFVGDMLSLAVGDIDMVCAPTFMQHANGSRERRAFFSHLCLPQVIVSGALSTQSMFFKRDFILRIGGWNEELLRWNDWELGVRALCYRPKITCAQQAYHTIYLHEDSITGVGFSKDYLRLKNAVFAVARLLEGAELTVRERVASQNALAAKLYLLSIHLHREKDVHNEVDAVVMAKSIMHRSTCFAFFAPLVRMYGILGGRGAWRLFECLVR